MNEYNEEHDYTAKKLYLVEYQHYSNYNHNNNSSTASALTLKSSNGLTDMTSATECTAEEKLRGLVDATASAVPFDFISKVTKITAIKIYMIKNML